MHGSSPPLTGSDVSPAELIAARPQLSRHALDGLMLEGVPLAAIAAELGTPTYVYSAETLRSRYAALIAALAAADLEGQIRYAVKANDHLAILRLLGGLGAGADVVSEGELLRALVAGIPAERIVFSGVGKSRDELAHALEARIGQINIESTEELDDLSELVGHLGRAARVALRVNPDVDAGTHAKITTGRAQDKFGIPAGLIPSLYARAAALPGIIPVGLALHIGSQVLSLAPFRKSFAVLAGLARGLRAANLPLERLDCGGGLGVPYANEPAPGPNGLAGALGRAFRGLGVELLLEPGRWLVAPAGLLLATVVRVKSGRERPFVVLDAGMNDLMRPALYDAWHGIVPVAVTDGEPIGGADVVGPICESADLFARNRPLPRLCPGDRVAVLDTGAYGRVMASSYNARPLAAEAMVSGERWAMIRPRQPFQDLWAKERVPDWL
ncbi:MAG: diaminopimelate decarboxylase [Rhodospirillales bacterium]|nr:diaminopimelate decarboxylase [Rhodospirillales bacterium]